MPQQDTYRELAGQLPVEWRGSLDDLAREGARRMLAAALEAEVAGHVAEHRSERDAEGRVLDERWSFGAAERVPGRWQQVPRQPT